MNSASQGKSTVSRIQPALEACRAGRTQRDSSRQVLGDTGRSATLQWRSTRSSYSWVCSSPQKREINSWLWLFQSGHASRMKKGNDGGGELKEGEEGLRLWSLHALGESGLHPCCPLMKEIHGMHAFQKWTVTVYSSFMDFWTQDLCFRTCVHTKLQLKSQEPVL